MPYIVKWSPRAVEDIRKAYFFLAEKNSDAAKAAAEAISRHATLLEAFPNAGKPAEDLDPEHRELLVPFGASGYVILYEMQEDTVFVLAVRHQKEAGY